MGLARAAVSAGALPPTLRKQLEAESASASAGSAGEPLHLAELLAAAGEILLDTHASRFSERAPAAYADAMPVANVACPEGVSGVSDTVVYDRVDGSTAAGEAEEQAADPPLAKPSSSAEAAAAPAAADDAEHVAAVLHDPYRTRVVGGLAVDWAPKPSGARAALHRAWSDAASLRAGDVPSLRFESRFESGNLRSAVREGATAYSLVLDPDTNTNGHTQWFFFRVTGMVAPCLEGRHRAPAPPVTEQSLWQAHGCREYTLSIINLEKPDSSFNQGMRPLVFLEGSDGESLAQEAWVRRLAAPAAPEGAPEASAPSKTPVEPETLWPGPQPGSGWRRMGRDIVYCDGTHFKQKRKVGQAPRADLRAIRQAAVEACGGDSVAADRLVSAELVRLSRQGGGGDAGCGAADHGPALADPLKQAEGLSTPDAASGAGMAAFAAVAVKPAPGQEEEADEEADDDDSGDDAQAPAAATPAGAREGSRRGKAAPGGDSEEASRRLHAETWSVVFPPGTSAAWFAYCFPYTFSDLGTDVLRWQSRSAACESGASVPVVDTEDASNRPETLLQWAGDSETARPTSKSWPRQVAATSQAAPGIAGARMLTSGHFVTRPDCNAGAEGIDVHETSPSLASFRAALADREAVSAGVSWLSALQSGRLPALGSLWASSIMHRGVLCHTLAGNPVPLLTITDFSEPGDEPPPFAQPAATGPASSSQGAPPQAPQKQQQPPPQYIPLAQRPIVILSGRVHPGETNASWLLRGAVDFLTSSAPRARALRRQLVFKVIPFLNPDGVVNGHHRTNLAGLDLNRQWAAPTRELSPTVWHLRALMLSAARQRRGPLFFTDFHGHSRKRNVFMFGGTSSLGDASRLFPALLAQTAPDFSFKACSFVLNASKVGTARGATWSALPMACTYTLEGSFAGATEGSRAHSHFSPLALQSTGHHFVAALHDLLCLWRERPAASWAAGVHPLLHAPSVLSPAGLPSVRVVSYPAEPSSLLRWAGTGASSPVLWLAGRPILAQHHRAVAADTTAVIAEGQDAVDRQNNPDGTGHDHPIPAPETVWIPVEERVILTESSAVPMSVLSALAGVDTTDAAASASLILLSSASSASMPGDGAAGSAHGSVVGATAGPGKVAAPSLAEAVSAWVTVDTPARERLGKGKRARAQASGSMALASGGTSFAVAGPSLSRASAGHGSAGAGAGAGAGGGGDASVRVSLLSAILSDAGAASKLARWRLQWRLAQATLSDTSLLSPAAARVARVYRELIPEHQSRFPSDALHMGAATAALTGPDNGAGSSVSSSAPASPRIPVASRTGGSARRGGSKPWRKQTGKASTASSRRSKRT
jgi:hypothetical protein